MDTTIRWKEKDINPNENTTLMVHEVTKSLTQSKIMRQKKIFFFL